MSSVVLSFRDAVSLPPEGLATIAKIDIEARFPASGTVETARVAYTDGLQGSGEPVTNVITWSDVSVAPGRQECAIRLEGTPSRWTTFDANADGRADISDAIGLLGFLFLGTAEPPCLAAMNFNGDAVTDITDAIAALGFLFQGDRPPRAGLGCQEYAGCPESDECAAPPG